MITQKRLKEVVRYCPETGVFSRNDGKKCGSLKPHGYIVIDIDAKRYYAHNLAFLYMTGNFPNGIADHLNHNRSDNRYLNLRDADYREQNTNRGKQSNNTSGHTGVHNAGDDKWVAQIKVGGKCIHLGIFKTIEEAISSRLAAEEQYKFHPSHGKGDFVDRNLTREQMAVFNRPAKSPLTWQQVCQIRFLGSPGGQVKMSQYKIASKYGVDQSRISTIVNNKSNLFNNLGVA